MRGGNGRRLHDGRGTGDRGHRIGQFQEAADFTDAPTHQEAPFLMSGILCPHLTENGSCFRKTPLFVFRIPDDTTEVGGQNGVVRSGNLLGGFVQLFQCSDNIAALNPPLDHAEHGPKSRWTGSGFQGGHGRELFMSDKKSGSPEIGPVPQLRHRPSGDQLTV